MYRVARGDAGCGAAHDDVDRIAERLQEAQQPLDRDVAKDSRAAFWRRRAGRYPGFDPPPPVTCRARRWHPGFGSRAAPSGDARQHRRSRGPRRRCSLPRLMAVVGHPPASAFSPRSLVILSRSQPSCGSDSISWRGVSVAALRLLLESVQHIDPLGEAHRVDHAVGVRAVILDELDHARAARIPLSGFALSWASADLSAIERDSPSRPGRRAGKAAESLVARSDPSRPASRALTIMVVSPYASSGPYPAASSESRLAATVTFAIDGRRSAEDLLHLLGLGGDALAGRPPPRRRRRRRAVGDHLLRQVAVRGLPGCRAPSAAPGLRNSRRRAISSRHLVDAAEAEAVGDGEIGLAPPRAMLRPARSAIRMTFAGARQRRQKREPRRQRLRDAAAPSAAAPSRASPSRLVATEATAARRQASQAPSR